MSSEWSAPVLGAGGLTVGYGDRTVIEGLDVEIPPRSFTVIIGPNACGKSTLLRTLARLLRPAAGAVTLDGTDLRTLPSKQVARTVGLLPQSSTAPEGITVTDLVRRGRFPHQGFLKQWSAEDEAAVRAALAATQTEELATRGVDQLSGGQRQRVWVALVLAQRTPILLLDEPTTFLDIAHQLELLNLFDRLHQEGRTLVAVLHDINQAARYATHLIAMRDGRIVASGPPEQVVTEACIEEIFGLQCRVVPDPETHTPMVIPLAHRRAALQPTTPTREGHS